ncbi:flagellar basal-body rod protein FlgC [Rhodovulum imhoffii]|uniref:Flagellar basal-body rod protein FlgC n=1 Tax=Rhodovulum imhoffii TaxID=365340 RepID=A0A2T5BRT0_9RHOB|nr:flagellar basal body rod protein FlgC [Rhodovulum imhoffii]MBK5934086.1 flagellar basal body rod protein FlgC [Rhodovulum imhoffii]PTN01971.1 flagellar basal-body rod protein FlgC [Rhodovulum imhoffii]
MGDILQTLSISASGMRAQAARLRHASENIANVDTPGYRRKLIVFEAAPTDGTVRTGPVSLDRSALPRLYDPSHPMADETGHYLGSNVDLVVEIADAREAQRSYDANVKILDQTRQMTRSLLDLLRR